jgi:hypothetical protein
MLHMQLAVRAPIYHAKLAGILYAVRSSFPSVPSIQFPEGLDEVLRMENVV